MKRCTDGRPGEAGEPDAAAANAAEWTERSAPDTPFAQNNETDQRIRHQQDRRVNDVFDNAIAIGRQATR